MGLINRIALSDLGQRFYKYAADPKNESFFNNTLPTIETGVATLCYIWATHKQKDIDDDRKALLQWQNVGSGLVGIALGSWLNRRASAYVEKIIPHLRQDLIPDAHKVVTGLKVAIPICVTALLMRTGIPSVIAWFSGKAEEVRRSKRDSEKQKLNIQA